MLTKIAKSIFPMVFLFSSHHVHAQIISLSGSVYAERFEDIFGSSSEFPLNNFQLNFTAFFDSSDEWVLDQAGRTTKSVNINSAVVIPPF